jgi:2-amino-4-hydroxy-6-hydroxymethyldihydropteridine diphosphokinase
LIYIGIGANLSSPRFGEPIDTCEAALEALKGMNIRILGRSQWYHSAPVPLSDQPWYVNGVARIETSAEATDVLKTLLSLESRFGRQRRTPGSPRIIDLDLLDYRGIVKGWGMEANKKDKASLILPHPRMHERAFVLAPLSELAPNWRHPVLGKTIEALKSSLPQDQALRPLS